MGSIILLEVIGVLLVWAVVGYTIWKWGPGIRQRSVRCPSDFRKATVRAEQREVEFGCLQVVDVKTCSLIPGQVPTCGKSCMLLL